MVLQYFLNQNKQTLYLSWDMLHGPIDGI